MLLYSQKWHHMISKSINLKFLALKQENNLFFDKKSILSIRERCLFFESFVFTHTHIDTCRHTQRTPQSDSLLHILSWGRSLKCLEIQATPAMLNLRISIPSLMSKWFFIPNIFSLYSFAFQLRLCRKCLTWSNRYLEVIFHALDVFSIIFATSYV